VIKIFNQFLFGDKIYNQFLQKIKTSSGPSKITLCHSRLLTT
jgi:hypothetical protein